jgi:hypothetical protein
VIASSALGTPWSSVLQRAWHALDAAESRHQTTVVFVSSIFEMKRGREKSDGIPSCESRECPKRASRTCHPAVAPAQTSDVHGTEPDCDKLEGNHNQEDGIVPFAADST